MKETNRKGRYIVSDEESIDKVKQILQKTYELTEEIKHNYEDVHGWLNSLIEGFGDYLEKTDNLEDDINVGILIGWALREQEYEKIATKMLK
jgi:hypothetical protein